MGRDARWRKILDGLELSGPRLVLVGLTENEVRAVRRAARDTGRVVRSIQLRADGERPVYGVRMAAGAGKGVGA